MDDWAVAATAFSLEFSAVLPQPIMLVAAIDAVINNVNNLFFIRNIVLRV